MIEIKKTLIENKNGCKVYKTTIKEQVEEPSITKFELSDLVTTNGLIILWSISAILWILSFVVAAYEK